MIAVRLQLAGLLQHSALGPFRIGMRIEEFRAITNDLVGWYQIGSGASKAEAVDIGPVEFLFWKGADTESQCLNLITIDFSSRESPPSGFVIDLGHFKGGMSVAEFQRAAPTNISVRLDKTKPFSEVYQVGPSCLAYFEEDAGNVGLRVIECVSPNRR